MIKRRESPCVSVSWLAPLMAGTTTCEWSGWFRAHHTGFEVEPSGFSMAMWTSQHTLLLHQLADSLVRDGRTVSLETQNRFRVRRSSGTLIMGRPDVISREPSGCCTVHDVKTGARRDSHVIQVMLYMALMPYASKRFAERWMAGSVVYLTGDPVAIPPWAVDDSFKRRVSYWLDLMESTAPPRKRPSVAECRFCDITVADCPERMLNDANTEADPESDVPF